MEFPQSLFSDLISTTTMVQPLPIETWYAILEESVEFPEFLDPKLLPQIIHPLDDPDLRYRNGNDYMNLERQKNQLKRVCKFWNTFLCRFDYRYVRAVDIFHDRVPKQALTKAIRIMCGCCGNVKCEKCLIGREIRNMASLVASRTTFTRQDH